MVKLTNHSMGATLLLDSANSLYDFVVRDGNGAKGLLESGISRVPDKNIQHPQERIIHVSTPQLNLPPIDLSKLHGPQDDQVVAEIAGAAQTLGFFQVVNHGVLLELLEALKSAAHKFFSMPPEEKKTAACRTNVKYGTSFVPEKEQALEWKDYVSMSYTTDEDALQYWPCLCKYVHAFFNFYLHFLSRMRSKNHKLSSTRLKTKEKEKSKLDLIQTNIPSPLFLIDNGLL